MSKKPQGLKSDLPLLLNNLYAVDIISPKGEETIHLKYAPGRKKLRKAVLNLLEGKQSTLKSVTIVKDHR